MISNDQRRYLFEELCAEIEWASRCWRSYHQLFGNPEHTELMRKVAPVFFGAYQRLLRDGILMSIQKLLDPAISKGDASASIEMLLQRLPQTADPKVTRRLKKRLNLMRKECEEIKDWRNREGAHFDLPTVLIQAPEPKVRLRVVKQLIKAITEFLTDFAGEFYPDITHVGCPHAGHQKTTTRGSRFSSSATGWRQFGQTSPVLLGGCTGNVLVASRGAVSSPRTDLKN